MPAYVNLPWMPQWGTFLQAIEAGTNAGLKARQLTEEAAARSEANRPRAGAPVVVRPAAAPQLAIPQATADTGIGPIGMLPPSGELQGQLETVPATSGLYRIDPSTGKPTTVVAPTIKTTPEAEATFTVPLGTMAERIMGGSPTVRGKASQLEKLGIPVPGTKPATGTMSPIQKAAMANQLAAQHPDWTREQIIAAVQSSSTPVAETAPAEPTDQPAFYPLPTGNTFGL